MNYYKIIFKEWFYCFCDKTQLFFKELINNKKFYLYIFIVKFKIITNINYVQKYQLQKLILNTVNVSF
jgi:hypothetical protein